MLRSHVVCAVFKRNFASYFSGLLGYLFIVLFVLTGALLAFQPQFFTNNLANLDQLIRNDRSAARRFLMPFEHCINVAS